MTSAAKLNISMPGLTILVAQQGAGKSTLIRFIMQKNRTKFSGGVVFCNTSFSGDSFDYLPSCYVHSQYNEKVILKLMEIQKSDTSRMAFCIFDDAVIGDQWHSKPFGQLITQLRHFNIWCCIATQYPYAIPPLFRTQAFNCCMFALPTKKAIAALYESYGQFFDTENDFRKFFLSNTGNYQFIHYDARNPATTIEEKYVVMKIQSKIPKFKIEY